MSRSPGAGPGGRARLALHRVRRGRLAPVVRRPEASAFDGRHVAAVDGLLDEREEEEGR